MERPKYPINREMDRRTDDTAQDEEWNYLEYLDETGDGAWIGNVFVDLKELVDRTFACSTCKCLSRTPTGKAKGLSCCAHFDVQVSRDERDRIRSMPGLADSLRAKKGTAARAEIGEHFERNEHYEIYLQKDKSGTCSFGFFNESGELFCGIHAHALETGLDLAYFKPAICQIFPLAYVELGADRFLLSVLTESNASAVSDSADNFQPIGCLTRRWKGDPPLYQGMKSAIVTLFGEDFYAALDAVARRRKKLSPVLGA